MSTTRLPLGDDNTSAEKHSSHEPRQPEVPLMGTHMSGTFQTLPGSLHMQRTANSSGVPFPGSNPSGPAEPFTDHGAGRQPAFAGNEPLSQISLMNNAPGSPTPFFTRVLNDPLPFPSNEPVEQLPFPSSESGYPFAFPSPLSEVPDSLSSNTPEKQVPPPVAQVEIGKKKKGISKQVMLFVRIAITLVLVALILKGVSWSEVANIYTHVHFTDLLIGLSLGMLGVIFSSYLWHRLVRAENIEADMAHLTRLYLIGVAFSNFLPMVFSSGLLTA